jgi:hypothetical protein
MVRWAISGIAKKKRKEPQFTIAPAKQKASISKITKKIEIKGIHSFVTSQGLFLCLFPSLVYGLKAGLI